MRQFLSFGEAASFLGTDFEGLRQALETNAITGLPAFAYFGDRGMLARLNGVTVEVEQDETFLRLANGRLLATGFPFVTPEGAFDVGQLGDQFADLSEYCFWEDTKTAPVAFELEGYFRVAAYDLKRAARRRVLPSHAHLAPASWWAESSPMPRRENGSPHHLFGLLSPDWQDYPSPPSLSELMFRPADLEDFLARRADKPNGNKVVPGELRRDKEQNLLRVIAGLWALSGLPDAHNTTADKLSGLFDTWGWDGPGKSTIADNILKPAAKLPRVRN